jgi:rubrerythrin
MELKNFGSIFNFAAELETADQMFYNTAAANPACAKHKALLEELAVQARKNKMTMLRARQENVTEMILEPIYGFSSESFLIDRDGAEKMTWAQTLELACKLEDKGHDFYIQAAEKIKALREVSRVLARTATRRAASKARLVATQKQS